MVKRINPSRLNKRLNFGHNEVVTTINGINTDKFVSDVVVWGGVYSNSLTQQYLLMGQNITDVTTFVVRHNLKLQNYTALQVDGKTYDHLVFNADGDDNHDSFDLITAKLVKKRGR